MDYSGTIPNLTDPDAYGVPLAIALKQIMDPELWQCEREAAAIVREFHARMGRPAAVSYRRDLMIAGYSTSSGYPVPQRVQVAKAELRRVRAEAWRSFGQRLQAGSLRIFGRLDTLAGGWELVLCKVATQLKGTGIGPWNGGDLTYWEPYVHNTIAVPAEQAARLYGPHDLVSQMERGERLGALEHDPDGPKPMVYHPGSNDDPAAVAAAYRAARDKLDAWLDTELAAGRFIVSEQESGPPLLRRPPPPVAAPPPASAAELPPGGILLEESAPVSRRNTVKATKPRVWAWFRERVDTWPKDKPFPSEAVDVADARNKFGGAISRDELRSIVIEMTAAGLVPEEWRKPGRRAPSKPAA